MSADVIQLWASFAAGVNALAGIALLVLYARSRPACWFSCFSFAVAGVFLAVGTGGSVGAQLNHAVPAAFVGFALSVQPRWPPWWALAGFVITMVVLEGVHGTSVENVVTICAWFCGAMLLMRCTIPTEVVGRTDATRRAVFGTLVAMPLITLAGLLLLDEGFILLAVPMTVLMQGLGLYGAVRFRMYEVSKRHQRSGRLAAHAVEDDRSRVVGEVGAMLAHEIRNPLTGIRSLTEQLGDPDVDDATRRSYADLILKEVDRLETLVKQVLERSKRPAKPAAGPIESDLSSLFSDLDALLSPGAEEQRVRLAWLAETSRAATSSPALGQALLNLVTNAITHSPEGSDVTVTAHRSGQAVEISVRDHGPGIPAGLNEQVFQPFFSRSGGTGLGLAIVRSLAEEHGWEVSGTNLESGGAEFLIRIPDAATPSAPATRRLVTTP